MNKVHESISNFLDDSYFDSFVPVVDLSIIELEAILTMTVHDFLLQAISPSLSQHCCIENSNRLWNTATIQLDRSGNIHLTACCKQCKREILAMYLVEGTEYESSARSLLMAKTGWNSFGDE